MKKVTKLFCGIIVMFAILLTAPSMAQEKMKMVDKDSSPRALLLKTSMQNLWDNHAELTRNVIFCLVDNLPGLEQAQKRLMQNQDDIGNAIKPYYGDDAGNKLAALLKTHIKISVDVVTSAKTKNTSALDEANKKWSANADEISVFLSNANPNYSLVDLKKMMNEHLTLTTDEAVQRIEKNYDADVAAYDKVRKELLEMSDMLSAGIAKQFPEKFKIVAVK